MRPGASLTCAAIVALRLVGLILSAGCAGPAPPGNATATPNVRATTVRPAMYPPAAADLTNASSPNAAYLQDNVSVTRLDQNASFSPAVNLQLVAGNLTRPMMLVSPADEPGLFVVEQTGTVRPLVRFTFTDGSAEQVHRAGDIRAHLTGHIPLFDAPTVGADCPP